MVGEREYEMQRQALAAAGLKHHVLVERLVFDDRPQYLQGGWKERRTGRRVDKSDKQ